MKIGLVELPYIHLLDPYGNNWVELNDSPLISKQILIASLEAGGFEVELFNLKEGAEQEELGTIRWKGMTLRKVIKGRRISSIDASACDAWGVTNNFTMYREMACKVVRHLAIGGKPIIMGGSDVLAELQPYFQAGATAIVTDKSGGANWSIFDYVLGKEPRSPLSGVAFADGRQYKKTLHPLHPQDWDLPSVAVTRACLGTTSEFLEPDDRASLLPIGSVIADMGCDRTCSFCQTPTYRTGYLRMTPQRTLEWCWRQKEAGAKSITLESDQFLGRVLFGDEGRQEVLDIVKQLREWELPFGWPNGIEIRKATRGRGRDRNPDDLLPDEEMVEAMWGWDGKVGCFYAYIPAERPFSGRQNYKKLLPWQQHCEMLKAIVRAGVPNISYGIIVGLPDDDNDSLLYLEEAIHELYGELKTINPSFNFFAVPNAIIPIPGTLQADSIRQSELICFDDPLIYGNMWTASCDTHHISYEQISDWQMRLLKVGDNWGILSAA
jgi:hypothetical protein